MQNVRRKSMFILAMAIVVLFVMTALSLFSTTNASAMVIEDVDSSTATIVAKEELIKVEEAKVTIVEPTRPGYRFEGWYLDSACTNKVTDIDSAEGQTMYAKWEEKTINETYNATSDTYEIYTRSQLLGIKNFEAFNPIYNATVIDQNISLCADIDLFSSDMWTTLAPYCGTFDGNGHTINNFKLTTTSTGTYGFFRRIENKGVVRNLKFANVTITSSASDDTSITTYVGTLAGICYGYITNCHINSGTITANMCKSGVGAIAGICDMGTISYCTSGSGLTISGNGSLGGMVGYAIWGATVNSCTNYATISYAFKNESRYAGGIAGRISDSALIKNCSNYGLVRYGGGYSWNSSIRPCMAQIVGWNLSGKLESNSCHKECEFKNLTSNQKKYCNLYEVGRIGE